MSAPSLHFIECPDKDGVHHMAYWSHGDFDAPHVVVCVHGLSRQGRDFDVLAGALVSTAREQGRKLRVVCPDVVGRGESAWLVDPMLYQVPTYVGDMGLLLGTLQALGAQTIDWVGTSMGGLIGMGVCGHPQMKELFRVRRLVLNDVGPAVQWAAIERIGQYLGTQMQFESFEQGSAAMWQISQGFGKHTHDQWARLSRPMFKPDPERGEKAVKLHYDPRIAMPFKAATQESIKASEAILWQVYDSIEARTMLLRGGVSDLLSTDTAREMSKRGPKAKWIEFPNVGHAPTLVHPEHAAPVVHFLLGSEAA
jgi:pimeloyl-ACP methyl ester carboxylesterase